MFRPSPAQLPPVRDAPEDPRFLELFGATPEDADVLMAGIPYDASVLGRKGAKEGPAGIREAMQFLSNHDADTDTDLCSVRLHDVGDVDGLDAHGQDVLAAHDQVRRAAKHLFSHGKPVVLMGGDHGLTFPHIQALSETVEGRIGIIVIDAHYDLRSYEEQPTSGTPFRRILEELDGRVLPANLVEIGIRPYANTVQLAHYAKDHGITIVTADQVRNQGMESVIAAAIETASKGVDHLWLSIDIDGLDQSIASGCSAPGAGGLTYPDVDALVDALAKHPLCRGMDLLEVAPSLDPTGNTCRTAAQLVASFVGSTTKTG